MTQETSQKFNSKLQDVLEIAHEAQCLAKDIVDRVSAKLQEEGLALPWRNRVLVGLALKMHSSFECLVEDAKRGRLEAMHHLKTLVETFIYFHWVAKDSGEKAARLVYAEGCRNKITFYEKNSRYVEQRLIDDWKEILADKTRGLEREWEEFKRPKVEQLAKCVGPSLADWYDRVYKLACEPAHIADLLEHMPETSGKISLDLPHTSHLQAYIALDYGLHIIFGLMKDASKEYNLGIEEKIGELEARLTTLRSQ
jgi:hypothetical protein